MLSLVKKFLGKEEEAPKATQETLPTNARELLASMPTPLQEWIAAESWFRRVSALAFILIVFGLGGPLWWKTTETYRAPFAVFPPKTSISFNIRVSVGVSDDSLLAELENVLEDLDMKMDMTDVLEPLTIKWDLHNAGKQSLDMKESRAEKVPFSDIVVNAILVLPVQWPTFSATHVVLGNGTRALVQWSENLEREKIVNRLYELVWEVMVDVPQLEDIVRRDMQQKMQPWQIDALSPSQRKRIVWNAVPLAMNYAVQVVVVHDGSSKRSTTAGHATLKVLQKMSQELKGITSLKISSEHLWDLDLGVLMEKDVQERWTLPDHGLERLLKQVDEQMQTVDSADALLKLVVLDTDKELVIVSEHGDESRGVAIAAWGGMTVGGAWEGGRTVAALRVLFGLDSWLETGWERSPVPLARWETQRLALRATTDSVMTAISSVRALEAMCDKISNIVVMDEVADKASRAVELVTEGLEDADGTPDLQKIREGRELAKQAVSDPSLLAMLYFPQDQKMAVYMPVALPTLLPLSSAVISLITWIIWR